MVSERPRQLIGYLADGAGKKNPQQISKIRNRYGIRFVPKTWTSSIEDNIEEHVLKNQSRFRQYMQSKC